MLMSLCGVAVSFTAIGGLPESLELLLIALGSLGAGVLLMKLAKDRRRQLRGAGNGEGAAGRVRLTPRRKPPEDA
jgi:hypothetical protein